jgi:hypothetical protein
VHSCPYSAKLKTQAVGNPQTVPGVRDGRVSGRLAEISRERRCTLTNGGEDRGVRLPKPRDRHVGRFERPCVL